MGIFSMSTSSLSILDMKSTAEGTGYNFKYTGAVNTGSEVMPLVGQLSKDGLKMYFTTQDFQGEKQLYVMKRGKAGETFGKPEPVKGAMNSAGYNVIMPTVSADEKTMVFVNSVDGTQKGNDLYISTRETGEDGTFTGIRPLDEINEKEVSDSYPWLSNDGLRIYFTKQKGSEITFHQAARKSLNDKFAQPEKLNVAIPKISNNLSCFLSADETEIFVLSGDKIYSAKRENLFGKFSAPVEIGQANDNGYMSGITMTQDNSELFVFNSIGFRNTQILRFINTEAGKGEKTKVTAAENKPIETR